MSEWNNDVSEMNTPLSQINLRATGSARPDRSTFSGRMYRLCRFTHPPMAIEDSSEPTEGPRDTEPQPPGPPESEAHTPLEGPFAHARLAVDALLAMLFGTQNERRPSQEPKEGD